MKTPRHVVARALTEWIEKAGDRPASQIRLLHAAENRPAVKVQTWIVGPSTNVTELTTTILDTASEHAQNGKGVGVEEYHLSPLFGAELEEGSMRRFLIPVVRDTSTDEGVGYTEAPTKTGMLHMDMRHLEKRHEQLDHRDSVLWDNSMREIDRLRKRCEKLENDLTAANMHLEEAKDQSLERKLKIYKANQEEERKDKVINAVIPVAMQLGNAVIGAPVFQVNTDDQSQQFMIHFLSSFNTKQLEHMYGAMDPQQRITFDAIMEEIKKLKQQKWMEANRQAQAKVNGVENDPHTMETMAKRSAPQPEGP